MSRNGSGVYTIPSNSLRPAVDGTTIDTSDFNDFISDLETAMSASIAKDGQTTITANLPMATYRHTGVGDGSARTDYAALGQLQDNKVGWVAAGGTVDAITATYSPIVTAVADGQLLAFRASGANTSATPTFSPNGLTARTIVKSGGQALETGDIPRANYECLVRYYAASTRWELLNPEMPRLAYAFKASQASTQTGISNNTFTQVTLGTEEYDGESCFASSTFTAPVSGIYHFDAVLRVNGDSVTAANLSLYVNGAEKVRPSAILCGVGTHLTGSADIVLDAGNTVNLYGLITGTTNLVFERSSATVCSSLSGHLVTR